MHEALTRWGLERVKIYNSLTLAWSPSSNLTVALRLTL